jgi:hypothetical protein
LTGPLPRPPPEEEAQMDPTRFDAVAIAVGQRSTRRAALGLFAALGITGLVREEAAAVCLPEGERCGGRRGTCCSGYCKKFCQRAPYQGTCTIEEDVCSPGGSGFCNGGVFTPCVCVVTLRGQSFCASKTQESYCVDPGCHSDADCEAIPGGEPGDRCISCASCATGRGCVSPCPALAG